MAVCGLWPSAISPPEKSFATITASTTAVKKRRLAIVARKIAAAPCIPPKNYDDANDWRPNKRRYAPPQRRKKRTPPPKRNARGWIHLHPSPRKYPERRSCSGKLRRLHRKENPQPPRSAQKKPAENSLLGATCIENAHGIMKRIPTFHSVSNSILRGWL